MKPMYEEDAVVAARPVPVPLRPDAAAGRHAVGRRAHPPAALPADAVGRELPAARRAHEPPRHRVAWRCSSRPSSPTTARSIVISHDRYLLDRIPDRIVEVRDGQAFSLAGRLRRLGRGPRGGCPHERRRVARRARASVAAIEREVVGCRACPRLVEWRERAAPREGRAVRRRDLLGPAGAGVRRPRGGRARRSGWRRRRTAATARRRIFTGDRSGDFLFGVDAPGRAREPSAERVVDDGLRAAWGVRERGEPMRSTGEQADARPSATGACPFLAREMRALDAPATWSSALGAFAWDGALRAAAALGHRSAPEAAVRARGRGRGRAVHAARLLPPDAAEHLHREAHAADDGCGVGACRVARRSRLGRRGAAARSDLTRRRRPSMPFRPRSARPGSWCRRRTVGSTARTRRPRCRPRLRAVAIAGRRRDDHSAGHPRRRRDLRHGRQRRRSVALGRQRPILLAAPAKRHHLNGGRRARRRSDGGGGYDVRRETDAQLFGKADHDIINGDAGCRLRHRRRRQRLTSTADAIADLLDVRLVRARLRERRRRRRPLLRGPRRRRRGHRARRAGLRHVRCRSPATRTRSVERRRRLRRRT